MGIKSGIVVLSAAALIAAGGIGSATAAKLISGQQIKDGSITSRDLSQGLNRKLQRANHSTGVSPQTGPRGPQGEQGPAGTAAYVGPHWSVVDRNVIGNGDSGLRAGPVVPPYGVGSLGLRTGSATDKAAFGNELDFRGRPLPTTVGYSLYTTGENAALAADNLPNISLEIDPTGPSTAGLDYASLVYDPTAVTPNAWTAQDASSAARWWLTGAAGSSTGCTLAHYCTLGEVRSALPQATLLTVTISKGRDRAFSGAVDGLRVDDQLFDFEPLGVLARAAD
ncbi:hypothetical protein GON03_20645 [Nocardioides sp. MAH-18]|uniref:Collagen-like protein n=1 Tax=Nocardioides agri TaxID=2682843 RepID=A0A6L6Y1Y6_9ACTN|nr:MULTISPECIES: hypothetical protein [unclassified Nocardioides]MBA2952433.1 hypothetical protein [Nocardioides sp. CGMCC 1.13656]MVQ51595.1 hypothetical protein [Nocardioides sp. MAH-18]